MPINSAWFAEKLADRQMSQRGLAKLMGLDPSAMSLMLRGYRRGTYNLIMMGQEPIQNVELAWASPVLWIRTVAI